MLRGMTTPVERPLVTLVVAVLNEAAHIERCLASILSQDYPRDALEVLVYDGGSTDESRRIITRLAALDPRIVLLDNPRRIQAAAWNLGIDRARGAIVGIISGHAELGSRYVTCAVETLERTGATMVGGPVRAVNDGLVGRAVALATGTPFGAGGARFRYTDREEEVDTVFMGVCRAETYRAFRFDESMVRDQDDELSYRILDAGGRIVCNPAIESTYRSRATLRGLARQYFEYGYWKVRVIERHPRQMRPRHLVPSALVASILVSCGLAVASPSLVWLPASVLAAYGTANVAFSLNSPRRGERAIFPVVSAVFAVLHLSYGTGMLAGLPGLFARRLGQGEDRARLTSTTVRPSTDDV
jgi:GT2 family glycosyltransferase